jgi:hypothetical protein
VTQCLAKNEQLNPADFTLVDKPAEKKLNFSLEAAQNRAQENQNRLLRGYRICCVETIRGGFDAFKSIVEANGGECTLFRGRVSMNESRPRPDSEDEAEDEDNHPEKNEIYLLSGIAPEQVKLWARFRQMVHEVGKMPRIVNVNWLLDIAMSQEIRWRDEYEVNEDNMVNGQKD